MGVSLIRAGDLRHQCILQEATNQTDSFGDTQEVWSAVATVWAFIRAASGRELFEAATVQAELSHLVTIRYRAGVWPGMRFLFNGRLLYITSVNNTEEVGEHLLCNAIERS